LDPAHHGKPGEVEKVISLRNYRRERGLVESGGDQRVDDLRTILEAAARLQRRRRRPRSR
jgi:hypothetical protein